MDEAESYLDLYEEWLRCKSLAARIVNASSKRTLEEYFKNLDKTSVKSDNQEITGEIKELLEYKPSNRDVAADRRNTEEILALVEILKEKNSPVSKILDKIH